MQVTTCRILSSTTAIVELAQPDHDNKAKLAKKIDGLHEQVSATSDDSNNLANTNLARLLASCGDCI